MKYSCRVKLGAQAIWWTAAVIGIVLMGFRALSGTMPGTFPPEPWPCQCEVTP